MHNAMQPVGASDRTKVRMERLRRIELEQQQWEQEALVMPEAWDQLLLATFESVKTEFSDLDGLSWSQYRGPHGVDPGVGICSPASSCVRGRVTGIY
ncbi:hypothetical protein EDC04DRAFT_2905200 [Pisolithus marmoratus]|nr:hypothetical protein EDC04DRAFT_2905200 [Pisolithus marmoratus]